MKYLLSYTLTTTTTYILINTCSDERKLNLSDNNLLINTAVAINAKLPVLSKLGYAAVFVVSITATVRFSGRRYSRPISQTSQTQITTQGIRGRGESISIKVHAKKSSGQLHPCGGFQAARGHPTDFPLALRAINQLEYLTLFRVS